MNEFIIPVTISDLPGFDFSVSPNILTQKILDEFENRPALPGVMIIKEGHLMGVLTRIKLFERFGHEFDLENLLHEPVNQLTDLIRSNIQPMPENSRIDEAIRFALSRSALDVYDPLVIQHDDGRMKLIDLNVLVIAQSRFLASLNNIEANLQQVDKLINSLHESKNILRIILQLLQHVVPFHQAALLICDSKGLRFIAQTGYRQVSERADEVLKSSTYALLMNYRQAIYFPNASNSQAWKGMEVLGAPISWLGVPLELNDQPFGLLSISRNVERAYDSIERKTVLVFVQRMLELFKHEQVLSGTFGKNPETIEDQLPADRFMRV
ncbi:MAG: GAF domain-containing protein, partial [Chloroflexota bacterium]